MSSTTKKVLIVGCAVALVLGIVIVILGGLALHRFTSAISSTMEMPAALHTPGVKTGQGVLTATVMWTGSGVGAVSDIAVGQFNGAAGS
ncbi:MAG TPA: hypothetical protein VM283_07315, partial [Armatimonadota bacterium]|nr:hypothetical protein [Armatimonadota bacterium]